LGTASWVHKPDIIREDAGEDISHKNRETSILTIKKKRSNINNSSTSHQEFQRRKDKIEKKGPKKKKHTK
jgi:hypothetical protein